MLQFLKKKKKKKRKKKEIKLHVCHYVFTVSFIVFLYIFFVIFSVLRTFFLIPNKVIIQYTYTLSLSPAVSQFFLDWLRCYSSTFRFGE